LASKLVLFLEYFLHEAIRLVSYPSAPLQTLVTIGPSGRVQGTDRPQLAVRGDCAVFYTARVDVKCFLVPFRARGGVEKLLRQVRNFNGIKMTKHRRFRTPTGEYARLDEDKPPECSSRQT